MTATTHPADTEPNPFEEAFSGEDTDIAVQDRPHRDCPEPMPISDLVYAETEHLLVGVDDPQATVHPFDGKCKVCDQPLPDKLWTQIDHRLATGYFPVNCCDKCFAEAMIDQGRVAHNRALWERICPTEFRAPWDNAKGSASVFKRIMEWAGQWNAHERKSPQKGLVIHGASDSAKTRVCWHLYRTLMEEGVTTLFIEAIDLLDDMPKEAFTVQCLIIDDLGNDTLDFRKEQRLLKLLRSRAQWHRPIVVTTQYNGSDLAARFKQAAAGEAVVRRLRDFCDSIHARKPGDGGITRDAQGRPVMAA